MSHLSNPHSRLGTIHSWKRQTVWFLLFLSLACAFHTCATAQERFSLMEYNVENLFDCRHDSLKEDTEFLPGAARKWTYRRYRQKLTNIAKVIAAVGESQLPDLVALCEVENDHVMRDLTRYSSLKHAGYRYVMTESPDRRGIDVALLYQPATFRLITHRSVRIPLKYKDQKPTRDILHVVGRVMTGDTLDVFVCHFPSRSGGKRRTEPFRICAATVLRAQIDSLVRVRQVPRIVVTGDFNDTPESKTLREVMGAYAPVEKVEAKRLYNLLADRTDEGSYYYQGEWEIIDQLMVTGALLDPCAPFHTSQGQARILKLPFLLTDDARYGGKIPLRTYYGARYQGGYSDHLPLLLQFDLKLITGQIDP